ncbi:DNA gyrase/topoisomerase IV subunit A [Thermocrinis minervae]|uniref:DNA topoisomerase (ATP-hydrolyzing) n=1 Tax=Thermocrinis minervae TaxID=381751 RepID=A0A1M6TKJ8_9AQUI|nr:DNA topoisomerase (ATP-hydrolyzing) [Thermocrinis minervae]SHK57582.1 DNA gyrase subunit A [Thermocrinis minervae]
MEIIEVPIEEEVKQAYIDYAMSVIVGRAIPDVRDGLKPVQRRILYSMWQMGLLPNKNFVKSARIVGTVLGYYHPHGDQAVYEALVRMAQDFNMRYPLIIGQGNFGSIDGDPPAAMRYTEAKLSQAALYMLEELEEDTVDFVLNFDGTTTEPEVLPSKFPNLLCNGTIGIAVGLATSIPPHNLREVAQALIELAKDPQITTQKIMEYIKAPDFPTGGIVENRDELLEYYEKGKGYVRVRAKMHVEKVHGGRERIVITEIPYQVNKAELIKRIAELVREGKIKEISDIRDESDKEGISIVIELKKDADSQKVIEKLLKNTALRKNFPLNFVVLVDGEPKQVGIKELLQEFLRHRLDVILRRSKYHLKHTRERLHVVEGLLVALQNIDNVIQDIRSSKDTQEAREKLTKKYNLTATQANAVLDMRLQRLTSLERDKLEKEREELKSKEEYYQKLVTSEEERIKVFIEEMEALIKEFPSPRKTFVEGLEGKHKSESLVVVIYADGQILPLENIQEEKEVVNILSVPVDDVLFLVSNMGRVYWVAGTQALQGSRVSLKDPDEVIVGGFLRSSAQDRLIIATANGYIKKIPLADFEFKAQGVSIIKLSDEKDRVVKILQSPEEGHLLIYTHRGKVLRINISDIPPAGVGSRGVIGIKLEDKDAVKGIRALKDEEYLLIVTAKGGVKKISQREIPLRTRGTKGVSVISRLDSLVDIIPVRDAVELMVITQSGKVFYDRIFQKDMLLSKVDDPAKKRWQMEQGDSIVRVVVK